MCITFISVSPQLSQHSRAGAYAHTQTCVHPKISPMSKIYMEGCTSMNKCIHTHTTRRLSLWRVWEYVVAAAHVSDGFVMKKSLCPLLHSISFLVWPLYFPPTSPIPTAHLLLPFPPPWFSHLPLITLPSKFTEVQTVKVATHTHTLTVLKVAQTLLAETWERRRDSLNPLGEHQSYFSKTSPLLCTLPVLFLFPCICIWGDGPHSLSRGVSTSKTATGVWCQTQCQEPRRVRASWIKLVRVLKNSRKVNQERVLRHIHTCTHRRIFEISNDESAFSSGFFYFF